MVQQCLRHEQSFVIFMTSDRLVVRLSPASLHLRTLFYHYYKLVLRHDRITA